MVEWLDAGVLAMGVGWWCAGEGAAGGLGWGGGSVVVGWKAGELGLKQQTQFTHTLTSPSPPCPTDVYHHTHTPPPSP